jgi:hypothetical protein
MDLTSSSIYKKIEDNDNKANIQKDYSSAFILKGFNYKAWSAIPNQLLADRRTSAGARDFWILLQALGNEKGCSFYSQKKLAKFLNIKVRTLQRYQSQLVKYGWIRVEYGGEYRSNYYYVIWPYFCPNPKWKNYLKKEKGSR